MAAIGAVSAASDEERERVGGNGKWDTAWQAEHGAARHLLRELRASAVGPPQLMARPGGPSL